MPSTIKTRSGRVLLVPTPEEDAAITAAAMADPDAMPFTDAEWEAVKHLAKRGSQLGSDTKTSVMVRLDIDIVERLRATGPDWQVRANDVLRKWVQRHA